MTTITLKLDDDLKSKLEMYASKHGQSLSDSAYYLLNRGYEIEDYDDLDRPYTEEEERLLYSPENVEAILKSAKELDEGKGILVTVEELRAMIK